MFKKAETKLIVENWRNFINENKAEETKSQKQYRYYYESSLKTRSIIQFVATKEGIQNLKKLGISLSHIEKDIPTFQLEDSPVVLNCLLTGFHLAKPSTLLSPDDPVGLGVHLSAYLGCWLDGKGADNHQTAYEPYVNQINALFDYEYAPEYGDVNTRKTIPLSFSESSKLFDTEGLESFQEYPRLKGVYFISQSNSKVSPVAYDGHGKEGIKGKLSDITVF